MKDRLSSLIAEVKSAGLRATTARRAVVESLASGSGHLSAEDIAEDVKPRYPDIHLSTVYRTLESLESAGIIDHVHLGHGRAIYHLKDDPHQHLVCEICGAVTQVPDDVFKSLEKDLVNEYGFQIRRNHFAVLGSCKHCRVPVK